MVFCAEYYLNPSPRMPTHYESMPDFTLASAMVQAHIERISLSKPAGPCRTNPQLLRFLAPVISEPLALTNFTSICIHRKRLITLVLPFKLFYLL